MMTKNYAHLASTDSITCEMCIITQEKSSLDWSKYTQEHGLEDELAHNSKDGSVSYLCIIHIIRMQPGNNHHR